MKRQEIVTRDQLTEHLYKFSPHAMYEISKNCKENIGVDIGDERVKAYVPLVPYCQAVVPEALLKERLDVETLDTLGIIPSQKAFNQKYVRTKTKLLCV